MNWQQIEGNWRQLRGKVREQWGRLTDDQLDIINGRREMLVGKIQESYGISTEAAERLVKLWLSSLGTVDASDSTAANDAQESEPPARSHGTDRR